MASNLILAPMSGVTDSAFRSLVRRCSGDSVGLLVSEFVASEGLVRDNVRTLSMLRFGEAERPISIQIFGADPAHMARSAAMVEQVGADIVDINCGCPAPKVVRRGGGAELLRNPDLLRDILSAVRAAVSIPFTVKIRSGWDEYSVNAMDIARLVEDSGAAMLAVHPRTRVQLYRGSADWDLTARIRESLSIPLAGSGDACDSATALQRLRGGFADALMIGRAAIADPWIFAKIAAAAAGEPEPLIAPAERAQALLRLRDDLAERYAEKAMVGRYRGLCCRMIKGMPGAVAVRRAIGKAADSAAVADLVSAFLEKAKPEADLSRVA